MPGHHTLAAGISQGHWGAHPSCLGQGGVDATLVLPNQSETAIHQADGAGGKAFLAAEWLFRETRLAGSQDSQVTAGRAAAVILPGDGHMPGGDGQRLASGGLQVMEDLVSGGDIHGWTEGPVCLDGGKDQAGQGQC